MTINKYEQIKRDVENLLVSGNIHSTLVGKQITLGGSKESTAKQANDFATYIADMIKKAENFRKGNVKTKVN
jgi:hypothetical protein